MRRFETALILLSVLMLSCTLQDATTASAPSDRREGADAKASSPEQERAIALAEALKAKAEAEKAKAEAEKAKAEAEKAKAEAEKAKHIANKALAAVRKANRPTNRPRAWDVKLHGHEPSMGNVDAPVTLVEFGTYQDRYTAKAHPTVQRILKNFPDEVRVVYKHYAMDLFGRSWQAALAAIAAHKQGKFWAYHDTLLAKRRSLSRRHLKRFARKLGLDVEQWTKDMKAAATQAILDKDLALIDELKVRGTPTFFVNGVHLQGAQPYEKFEKLIKEELRFAKEQSQQ